MRGLTPGSPGAGQTSPRLGDTGTDFCEDGEVSPQGRVGVSSSPPPPHLFGPRASPSTASRQGLFSRAGKFHRSHPKKDFTLIKTVTSRLPFENAGPSRRQTSGAAAGAAGGSVGRGVSSRRGTSRGSHPCVGLPPPDGAPTHVQHLQKATLGRRLRAARLCCCGEETARG